MAAVKWRYTHEYSMTYVVHGPSQSKLSCRIDSIAVSPTLLSLWVGTISKDTDEYEAPLYRLFTDLGCKT